MGWIARGAGLLAVAAMAGCAAPLPVPQDSGTIDGTAHMADAEAGVIAASHGRARREDGRLILALANGQIKILQNKPGNCDDGPADCEHYILTADNPAAHWYVVFGAQYEGGETFLVDDRNGVVTPIPLLPVFSSDGTRFLILNDDESGFFPGESIEIWRRDRSTAVREWIANPTAEDFGVAAATHPDRMRFVSWQGDRITVRFIISETFDSKRKAMTPARSWNATITRESDGWHLRARAPRM